MNNVLTFIMAGGKGSRLHPLTINRAKPAVHFGGKYRIIDFVINNFINSGFYKIKVLTQYKSSSLSKHISSAFNFNSNMGMFVDVVPAQMRKGEDVWYRGTADAVGQNINEFYDEDPEYVAVFGGDHIFKMDVKQMLDYHKKMGAKASVAAIPVPIEEASEFGIIQINEEGRIIGFQEKPKNPAPMPGNPKMSLVSMGNYFFDAEFLEKLINEYVDGKEAFDFGHNIFPEIIDEFPVYAYDFSTNEVAGRAEGAKGYWRDVGNVDALYEANMELISVTPPLDLYNNQWPIRTTDPQLPPPKFVFNDEGRRGVATDSMIGEGVIVSGGSIHHSIICKNCRIHSYSDIQDSVISPDCSIGENVKLKKVIVDRNIAIPAGIEVGYDLEKDKKYFTISDEGVVVIPQDFDWTSYEQ